MPINVYISYHDRDLQLVKELETTLQPLVKDQQIRIWNRKMLRAGEVVSTKTQEELRAAKIFILMGSADAIADDKIQEEWTFAKRQSDDKQATAMAILARAANMKYTPAKDLRVFPGPKAPLDHHPHRAEALNEILEEVEGLVERTRGA